MTTLKINQSNIAAHFETKMIYEPNFHQVEALSKNEEFQTKLATLADAQSALKEANIANGPRNKVIKARTLLVLASIITPIAATFLVLATFAILTAPMVSILAGVAFLFTILGSLATITFFPTLLIITIGSFLDLDNTAILNNGSITKLNLAKDTMQGLKAEMNDFIAEELPHATEAELQSLETHFLEQVEVAS